MFRIKLSLFLGGTLLLFIFAFSCTEAPFQPEPNTPYGYKVYIRDHNVPNRWYIYYPETNYLDSINFPAISRHRNIHSATISPNGDKLFWAIAGSNLLSVVDINTGELIQQFDDYYDPSVAHSPDGQHIVIECFSDLLDIRNADDLSLIYRDTTPQIANIVFDANNHTLFGTYYDRYPPRNYLARTEIDDLDNNTIDTVIWDNKLIFCQTVLRGNLPHQLFVFGHSSYNYMFLEINTETNDFIYADTSNVIGFAASKMVISPNKRWVINISADINAIEPSEFPCEFRIYDTQLHQQIETVSTRIEISPGDTTYFDSYQMVITPDSKYAIAISTLDSGHILIFNLEEMKIERLVTIPGEPSLSYITCQTGE